MDKKSSNDHDNLEPMIPNVTEMDFKNNLRFDFLILFNSSVEG